MPGFPHKIAGLFKGPINYKLPKICWYSPVIRPYICREGGDSRDLYFQLSMQSAICEPKKSIQLFLGPCLKHWKFPADSEGQQGSLHENEHVIYQLYKSEPNKNNRYLNMFNYSDQVQIISKLVVENPSTKICDSQISEKKSLKPPQPQLGSPPTDLPKGWRKQRWWLLNVPPNVIAPRAQSKTCGSRAMTVKGGRILSYTLKMGAILIRQWVPQ